MIDKLKTMLAQADADYADLRYEIKHETKIGFNGPELTHVSVSSTDGYVLRVLKGGGFATLAFTREADAEKALRTALENARLIAKNSRQPVRFAPADAVRDEFRPSLDEDPRRIALDEKIELTKRYNDLARSNPGIATTNIGYTETIREKHFASTEGAAVSEDLVTVGISGLITSREGNLIQNARVAVGGSNGFRVLRGREDVFDKKKKIVLDLLKAQPVPAGTHHVILNNSLAGVFTHEAFGHFSEADIIEDVPTMRAKMRIGAPLGSDVLSITDDPTRPDQLGLYRYDDEGVAARSVALMSNGVLTGRLHSRRTAAEFGEPINGHCVAEDYRYAPIIRMGCIFIEPRDKSREELLARLGDGLYLCNHMGGQTTGENFTFGAQFGFEVKDGKPGRMIRDINISGSLYETLKNISAVANDLTLREIGGCGKGQTNHRSCNGAPHVLVDNLVVGGR
jgi:predicted Zn-dependent protease